MPNGFTGNGYYADFTVLAGEVEQLAALGSGLDEQLNQLITTVKNTLDPEHWTTGAAQLWSEAQTTWNQNSTTMNSDIKAAENALSSIFENLQVTEQQAQKVWQSTNISNYSGNTVG